MGALTGNRKRGDNFFSLSFPLLFPSSPDSDLRADLHISKKPRISSMQSSPEQLVSTSIASRIRKYPEQPRSFRREVHAPCRKSKFVLSRSSDREFRPEANQASEKEDRVETMGNCLSIRHIEAKSSGKLVIDAAAGYSKNVVSEDSRKGKMVIDVEAECSVSEDSSIEEVEILDDGREGHSSGYHETNGDIFLSKAYAKPEDHRLPLSSSVVSELTNTTSKMDSAGKMMESLSVNREAEMVEGVLLHKKLLESARRRNPKLGSLDFQIKLQEKKRSTFRLWGRPVKKPEEELFTPLRDEEVAEVSRVFQGSNRRKVLVKHENSNIEITGEILQCLKHGAWLNDEVINLYLELLKERENREPKKFLKCHFFNTFFYKKLISGRTGYDYKAVRRWTTPKKIGYGLIECDKIFVPIHKEVHWCLAVINKKDEKFQYLDSLKSMDSRVLKVLARYFVDEVKDKSGEDIDISSWKHEYVDDLPEQENGFDCGMFMIKYADFYSRGLGLCFNQEHMSYFRMRTIKEILRLKAE